MNIAPIRTVALYGCGTIGACWAGFYASRGLKVKLYDIREDALRVGHQRAVSALEGLVKARLCEAERFSEAKRNIHTSDDERELLEDADFVQESVLESYAIKREAHKAIERYAPPSAIIASSSSGLLASRMQEGLEHPGRFLIAHPFNPPHLVPLVELVPGPKTDEQVTWQVYAFYESLRKIPVILNKEVPGHLANRLAVALWREAIDLVASGVASLEDVDKALYAGPGLRWAFMGQHLTYHLAGGTGGYEYFFEHLGPQLEVYLEDLAHWKKVPGPAKKAVLAQMRVALDGREHERLEQWRDDTLAKLIHVLYQDSPNDRS